MVHAHKGSMWKSWFSEVDIVLAAAELLAVTLTSSTPFHQYMSIHYLDSINDKHRGKGPENFQVSFIIFFIKMK